MDYSDKPGNDGEIGIERSCFSYYLKRSSFASHLAKYYTKAGVRPEMLRVYNKSPANLFLLPLGERVARRAG